MEFIIFLVIVAVAIFFIVKSNKKEKAEAGVVLDQGAAHGLPFSCVIEGTVDGSPMADRIKALAIEAEAKKMVITGDYVADYKAQGGEMHLIGSSFKFTIDATGQIVQGQSHVNLFGDDWPCEGGMNPDGTLGISIVVTDKVTGGVAKVGVEGRVVNGAFLDGKARKGVMPHIWGALNGTYRRTGA